MLDKITDWWDNCDNLRECFEVLYFETPFQNVNQFLFDLSKNLIIMEFVDGSKEYKSADQDKWFRMTRNTIAFCDSCNIKTRLGVIKKDVLKPKQLTFAF